MSTYYDSWRDMNNADKLEKIIDTFAYRLIDINDCSYFFDYVGTGIDPDLNCVEVVGDWAFGDEGDGFYTVYYLPTDECWACHFCGETREQAPHLDEYFRNLIQQGNN